MATCHDRGLKERTRRLEWAAVVLGRDVGSFSDLSAAEASLISDRLRFHGAPRGERKALRAWACPLAQR